MTDVLSAGTGVPDAPNLGVPIGLNRVK